MVQTGAQLRFYACRVQHPVAYLFATHCQKGRLSDKGQAQHRLPAMLLAVKRPHVLNTIHLNDGLLVESNAIADNAQGAIL